MNIVHTGAWIKLIKLLKSDKADLLERLVRDQSESETANLRGRIQQIDDILEAYPQRMQDEQEED